MLLEATLAYFSAVLCYVATAARHLRATWRQDEAQERQDEVKHGRRCAQGPPHSALTWPTVRQHVPNMANLEPKMGNLAHFWEHLVDFFDFWGDLVQTCENPKNDESTALLKVSEAHGNAFWMHVGVC